MSHSETSPPVNYGSPEPALENPATAPDTAAPPDNASNPGIEDNEDDADDPGADGQPKRARGVQKRIDELTANWRNAERRVDELSRMLQGTLGQGQQPSAQPPQQPAVAPLPPDIAQWVGPAPDPAKFAAGEFDPEFIRAAAKHDIRLDQAHMAAQQRAAQAQNAQVQFGQRVASIMEQAVTAHPAIAATLNDPSFPMAQHVVRALTEADSPAEVLAHLARNREEAARISKLSPPAALKELLKIEARMSASASVPSAPTAAPPPPRPVRGAGAPPPDVSKMSYAEYKAHRGF